MKTKFSWVWKRSSRSLLALNKYLPLAIVHNYVLCTVMHLFHSFMKQVFIERLQHTRNFFDYCIGRWIGQSEVAQSCPTLCDPMDYSLPGSSVHGIFQARVLEWIAISFSRGSSWPRDRTQVSCVAGRDALPSEPPGKPRRLETRWKD